MTTTQMFQLAQRAANARSSVVREILKVTQRPEVISFAGGLPAPELFPVAALREAFDETLRSAGASALQYSTTEGDTHLRAWIAAHESELGIPTTPEQVLIVSGSQQALDLVSKAFIDASSPVLVESPTYLGALQAFAQFAPTLRAVPTDNDGLIPDALDAELTRDARFLYVMPNFQNPSGRTLTSLRRMQLAHAARKHNLLLIEDDPYGELWYREAPPLSLRAYAPERTLRLGSFSKVLAPGLRLGYVIGPRELINVLVLLKQATDLHTATLTQRAAYAVLNTGVLQRHLPAVRAAYANRCDAMLQALQEHLPSDAHITRPQGGMFVWVTLSDRMDTTALLQQAIERNVAFVPGAPFYANDAPKNTLRLSFVTVSPERIETGVRVLGELLSQFVES